jgi:hypothetical protein
MTSVQSTSSSAPLLRTGELTSSREPVAVNCAIHIRRLPRPSVPSFDSQAWYPATSRPLASTRASAPPGPCRPWADRRIGLLRPRVQGPSGPEQVAYPTA